MRFKLHQLLAVLSCLVVAALSQNCGRQSGFSINELAQNHSPSMLEIDTPHSKARVGDRVYISSVFAEIFLPHGEDLDFKIAKSRAGEDIHKIADYISSNYDTQKDKPILENIKKFILTKPAEFHGNCSVVEKDPYCRTGNMSARKTAAEVQTFAAASVTREGYRISACHKILSYDRAVENMIFNLVGDESAVMRESDIFKIYDAFYPGKDLNSESYQALREIYNLMNDESELDKWRAVAVPVCQSAGWQVL